MDFIIDLITNPYLLTGLGAWFVAQVLKTIIYAVINKKIVWERMIGDGGMPSGHSATVTSMAVFAALRCGANSYEFAIAGILAVIVCHDAMGHRPSSRCAGDPHCKRTEATPRNSRNTRTHATKLERRGRMAG